MSARARDAISARSEAEGLKVVMVCFSGRQVWVSNTRGMRLSILFCRGRVDIDPKLPHIQIAVTFLACFLAKVAGSILLEAIRIRPFLSARIGTLALTKGSLMGF